MTSPAIVREALIERLTKLLAKAKLPWSAPDKFWIYEDGKGAGDRVSPVVRAGLDDFDAGDKTALIVEAVNALPELLAALAALDATPGEGEMPTIWEDPAGKGYPCLERAMTPREARETIDRYGARICELEGEGWQDVSTANASAMFGASTWVLVATDRGRVTEGTPFFHDNSGNWIWVCARGSNCSDPRCPSEMLLECVVNWRPLPAAPLSGSVVK